MVPAPKNSCIVGFAAAKIFPIQKTWALTCAWLPPVICITGNLTAHCIDSLSLSNIQETFINTY